ncbi:MAG: polysaccharide biosynthesis tyrosine autokinase [Bacteroidales bacterium]|nr:polysaccharide biosynthesis tyrosine autokinase [Bacteroidales bacterium]
MAKNNSDFIDIAALVKQYISKWYLFAISVFVCLAIAFFYVSVRQQEYAVKANLLISTEDEGAAGGMGSLGALFGSQGYVDDEIFIVSSHSLYKNVARDLGLNISYIYHKNPFVSEIAYPNHQLEVVPQAGLLDTLERGITFKVKVNEKGQADIDAKMKRDIVAKAKKVTLPYTLDTPLGKFTFAKTNSYPEGESVKMSIAVFGYDQAAEGLDESVNTEIASKRSNVISLSINTTNPLYGKAILNEIIKKYNERGVAEKKSQNELSAEFIDSRLDILANELSQSESNIQDYKQRYGIVDLVVDTKYNTEKKARLEEALLEARTQEEVIALTRDFIREPRNAYALIPSTLPNEGLQRAIEAYNELVLKRSEMLQSAKPDNASLVQISEQLDMMRGNIGTSLDRALETSKVSVRDLSKEMASTQGSLSELPVHEREYLDLMRQQSVKQQLFMFLLRRREEVSLLLANSIPKGILIDEAYTLSDPLGMGKKMIMLIALFFGLLIPPVWLYIRRLIHNRFETRAEVERITDVPIVGEMCIDNSGRRLVVASDDTSATAELFRLMRSNLLFILNDPRDKVVLLTSTSSGEGKSFISINLAASLALTEKRVLLVGMDIRNPQLANYLNVHPRFGLTQYLSSSSVSIGQIIEPMPGVKNLDLIVAGPVPPNPAELLISHKVDELFQELRQRYDYIIVDTAPIGLVSDTFTLDRIADAAIYVCRANYTSLNDLNQINDIYEHQRLKKLSLVINGTATKKTYGYGQKKSGK